MSPEQSSPPISTMLMPTERTSVDAAGQGLYQALHRDSVDEVIRDVRERPVAAILVSVARFTYGEAMRVAAITRDFPRIPAIAILSAAEPSPQAVLSLGRSGVRTLIDVRSPEGWRTLRMALADDQLTVDMRRAVVQRLAEDLACAPPACWVFFEALFTVPSSVTTARDLCRILHVTPGTFASRFLRHGLPTPRAYLNMARLTRAARLLENPGMSIANVANRLEYSSPQAFGRHIQVLLAMHASDFRRNYDGDGMLERFRREMVFPYVSTFARFRPC